MTENEIINNLQLLNIDTKSALERFLDNKEMYINFIKEFATDTSFNKIEDCLKNEDWTAAFELAHSLKGTTGNLGMTSLFETFSKICVAFRNQDYKEMETLYYQSKIQYANMCVIIKKM